jgi:hypothetical protein
MSEKPSRSAPDKDFRRRVMWASIAAVVCVGIGIFAWPTAQGWEIAVDIVANRDGSADWTLSLPPSTWHSIDTAPSKTDLIFKMLFGYLQTKSLTVKDCELLGMSRQPDETTRVSGHCRKLLRVLYINT